MYLWSKEFKLVGISHTAELSNLNTLIEQSGRGFTSKYSITVVLLKKKRIVKVDDPFFISQFLAEANLHFLAEQTTCFKNPRSATVACKVS